MKKLAVHLTRTARESIAVGQLAEVDHRVYFEYDPTFIERGLQISPFKLPLKPGLLEHVDHAFGPLPGVFDDSLPDGWGRLLMDRHFRREKIDPATVSPLDRLAYLDTRTMGALTYHPPQDVELGDGVLNLHDLARNAQAFIAGEANEVLPALMRAGGSPGGARPKVLVGLKGDAVISGEGELPAGYEPWIVKFAAKEDVEHAGPVEYAYALMAQAAGVDMPPCRLMTVRKGESYFAVQRFDRRPLPGGGYSRVHVHTFGNLIHANFRIPSTDYSDLLKVTTALTRNHQDVLRVFRQMVFNIAAHNRDDHAKNFAFVMSDAGEWSLSLAYDLTFAVGPGGEHTMTLMGEGRLPTLKHCLDLARGCGIKVSVAKGIVGEVFAGIERWSEFAAKASCPKARIRDIALRLKACRLKS